jgi:hypothetical protein
MPLSTHPDATASSAQSQSPEADWRVSPLDAPLAEAGFRVSLFERRPYLGGRASSYQHPGTGEIVDNCQHVLLGCCTNLLDFYRRAGVEDKIRWYEKLTFLEPGGRASVIGPSLLPAPLHTAPAFLRADCLNFRDKLAISRAMAALAPVCSPGSWRVVSRLAETPRTNRTSDRAFLEDHSGQRVERRSGSGFRALMRRRWCASLFLNRPLPGAWEFRPCRSPTCTARPETTSARGGEIQFRASVESFRSRTLCVSVTTNGQEQKFDYLFWRFRLMCWRACCRITHPLRLWPKMRSASSSSPITGIHLWFDRQISDLDHAVLLDRTIQWMFHKSRIIEAR